MTLQKDKYGEPITAAGTQVKLDEIVFKDRFQLWEIGFSDSSGYFNIRNLESKRFLTAVTPPVHPDGPVKLTIEGMYFFYFTKIFTNNIKNNIEKDTFQSNLFTLPNNKEV